VNIKKNTEAPISLHALVEEETGYITGIGDE
jgi:hypothetical protein